jgi:hypothetical protein
MNIGPVLPADRRAGYVAPIGDDVRKPPVSQRVVRIPWFLVNMLHMKDAELKITGVLQGLPE